MTLAQSLQVPRPPSLKITGRYNARTPALRVFAGDLQSRMRRVYCNTCGDGDELQNEEQRRHGKAEVFCMGEAADVQDQLTTGSKQTIRARVRTSLAVQAAAVTPSGAQEM